MNRRSFLAGLAASLAAPAIVRPEALMRIAPRALIMPEFFDPVAFTAGGRFSKAFQNAIFELYWNGSHWLTDFENGIVHIRQRTLHIPEEPQTFQSTVE